MFKCNSLDKRYLPPVGQHPLFEVSYFMLQFITPQGTVLEYTLSFESRTHVNICNV